MGSTVQRENFHAYIELILAVELYNNTYIIIVEMLNIVK